MIDFLENFGAAIVVGAFIALIWVEPLHDLFPAVSYGTLYKDAFLLLFPFIFHTIKEQK